jgi:hypothetical protein
MDAHCDDLILLVLINVIGLPARRSMGKLRFLFATSSSVVAAAHAAVCTVCNVFCMAGQNGVLTLW